MKSMKPITMGEIDKLDKWSRTGEDVDGIDLEHVKIDEDVYPELLELEPRERRVLFALIENCFTEQSLSNEEIAKKANVHPHDINIMRSKRAFGEALVAIAFDAMKSHVDIVIGHLFRQSALNKTTATRLYFEICGLYKPVSRTMMMRVDMDMDDLRGKPPSEMKEEVVQEWKRLGWSKEEFEDLWKE